MSKKFKDGIHLLEYFIHGFGNKVYNNCKLNCPDCKHQKCLKVLDQKIQDYLQQKS